MAERSSLEARTVVLVHGGFVDGSGWEGVYKILRKDGYTVAIVDGRDLGLHERAHLFQDRQLLGGHLDFG